MTITRILKFLSFFLRPSSFILVFKYIFILPHFIKVAIYSYVQLSISVTLEHKSSLKSLGYICSNSQKIHCMGQNDQFFFYAKDH